MIAVTPRRVRTAWLLALYLVVMATGLLPLFSVSALSPVIVADGLMTGGQLGLGWGALFGVAALTSIVVGRVVDATGERAVVAGLLVVNGAVLGLISLADSPGQVMAAYAAGGVGAAAAFTVTNKGLGLRSGAARGSAYIGVAHAGTQVGALAAGLALPAAAAALGWRPALALGAAVAVLGLVLLGVGAATGLDHEEADARQDPAHRPGPADRRGSAGRGDSAEHGAHRPGRPASPSALPASLYLYAVLTNGAATATVGYLPLYANVDLGLSASTAAVTISVSAVLAILGKVAWGWVAGRAQTWWTSAVALAAGAAVAVALLLGGTAASPLLWAGVVVAGACGQSWAVVTMSGVVRLADPRAVGRASGKLMTSAFAGAALLPPVYGQLAELTGAYGSIWALMLVLYLVSLAAVLAQASVARRRMPSATPPIRA